MRPSAIAMLLLPVLLLGSASAIAKPRPASGANCSSDWVNNAGAMNCFIQGEEDTHNGVAHPHYVACLNGDVFCCVDTSAGQHCEAQARAGRAGAADWMRAILAAQSSHIARVSKMPLAPENKWMRDPPFHQTH